MTWLEANPVLAAIIRVALWVFPVLLAVPPMIWYERRLLSWMQDRIGPNRTGNITFSRRSKWVPGFLKGKKFGLKGVVQPLADGLKLIIKEDITPGSVDRFIYLVAPALALFPSFALGATIPWGPFKGLTPVADVNIGVLWILAISSLGVYGVVLSGYASNNKYSLLGGLRSSAQLISYELGMGMSLAAICLATGSLKPTDIVESQTGPLWGVVPGLANWNLFTPYGFVAGVIFFVCMVAETNRAPFDLPEAENELVAGYHTEYSSMRFAVFFMGEYAAMFVYSLIFSTVFLGGYHAVPINWQSLGEIAPGLSWVTNAMQNVDFWLSPVWLVGKAFALVTVYVWLRATLPRLRYDQLMSLGWKSLLPLATINTIVVALWMVVSRVYSPIAGVVAGLLGFGILYLLYRALNNVGIDKTKFLTSREIELVDVQRSVV
jgi:NADH-quinone oxidoreductase subunit H